MLYRTQEGKCANETEMQWLLINIKGLFPKQNIFLLKNQLYL